MTAGNQPVLLTLYGLFSHALSDKFPEAILERSGAVGRKGIPKRLDGL